DVDGHGGEGGQDLARRRDAVRDEQYPAGAAGGRDLQGAGQVGTARGGEGGHLGRQGGRAHGLGAGEDAGVGRRPPGDEHGGGDGQPGDGLGGATRGGAAHAVGDVHDHRQALAPAGHDGAGQRDGGQGDGQGPQEGPDVARPAQDDGRREAEAQQPPRL